MMSTVSLDRPTWRAILVECHRKDLLAIQKQVFGEKPTPADLRDKNKLAETKRLIKKMLKDFQR